MPYYDALGNLALLTDLDAEIVERYEYSPLGKRRIFADSTPPEVTQIRWADGALHVELSEPVRQAQFLDAFATNASQLINLTQGDTLVTLDPPVAVGTGRDAGRHWILRPTEPGPGEPDSRPQPGESLTLTLASTSLEDHFGNQPSGDLFQALTWPSGEAVLADTTAPQLESVCVTADGRIEIVASEILDSATLSAITVDGGTLTWTPIGDGRAIHSAVLSQGNTTLDIPTTVTDLVGLGLAEGLNETFDVEAGQVAALFSRLPSGELATSAVGNPFGFKGLPLDEETGFYYVRRRYYDPELGRFITPDPYGYVDGPAMTAHAMNNPVSYSDPMGEFVTPETLWDGTSLTIGIISLRHNYRNSNWGLVAVDSFGVALDAVAVTVPILPGGASAALKASRAVGTLGRAQRVDQAIGVVQGIGQSAHSFGEGNVGMGLLYGGMSALGVRHIQSGPYLYGRAPLAKREIDSIADEVAGAFGGRVAKAPLKSRDRAAQKIIGDYGGDASQIKDLARNTIIVPEGRMDQVAVELARRGATVKQIRSSTDPLGYSGINAFMKTRSGVLAEIQVNSPAMIYGKSSPDIARRILGEETFSAIATRSGVVGGQGHRFYEQWRVLDWNTPQARAIAMRSRAYYDAVRRASGN